MRKEIIIPRDEEKILKAELETRHDPEAERMKRYLAMPDLSRISDSPIYGMVHRILALPDYKNFDVIEVPTGSVPGGISTIGGGVEKDEEKQKNLTIIPQQIIESTTKVKSWFSKIYNNLKSKNWYKITTGLLVNFIAKTTGSIYDTYLTIKTGWSDVSVFFLMLSITIIGIIVIIIRADRESKGLPFEEYVKFK